MLRVERASRTVDFVQHTKQLPTNLNASKAPPHHTKYTMIQVRNVLIFFSARVFFPSTYSQPGFVARYDYTNNAKVANYLTYSISCAHPTQTATVVYLS